MRQVALAGLLILLTIDGCGWSDSGPLPATSGATPEEEAARVFAIAQDLEDQGEHKKAFAAYHQLFRNFPSTDAGKKAIARVKKAQSDSLRKTKSKKR